LLLVFLLLVLAAGLFLLPAGTLLRSLLPRGREVPDLFLLAGDDFTALAVLAEALATGLRAADFLPALVTAAPAFLEDVALTGRAFRTPCFEVALVLERDEPAPVLTLVFLVFGMPCNRSGWGEILSLLSCIQRYISHRGIAACQMLSALFITDYAADVKLRKQESRTDF
jgi:hypothetical protein